MKDHLNWIKRVLGADDSGSLQEENVEVLRRMETDGDDLTQPRDVDFHHLFAHEDDAAAFQQAARAARYFHTNYDFWQEQNTWLTSVSIQMVPNLEEITATELALNEIAVPLGGKADGWGCVEIVATPVT